MSAQGILAAIRYKWVGALPALKVPVSDTATPTAL
jgi:hypothetical protein